MKQRILPLLVLAACATAAHAKLPPPDDATKAKAAETTAKAAWQAKVDAFQLCKAQDRIAAKAKGGAKGGDAKMTQTAAKPGAAPAGAAQGGAAAPGTAAPGATTPVASAPPAPCTDPGVFAYNPPEQKPLETSGAHSPSGTAASPPSVRPESAQMTPSKPSVAPSGTQAPAAPAAAPAKKS